jgi:FAD dependent oxidoreductase
MLMPEASVVRPTRVATTLLHDVPQRATRVESVDEVLGNHDIAIIAAGAWSQPLLNQVGVDLNVSPRRGQMMVFDRGDLPHVIRTTNRQVALPRADGRVAVGVTWETPALTRAPTSQRWIGSRRGHANRCRAWDSARRPGRGYALGLTATSRRSDGPAIACWSRSATVAMA